MVIPARRFEDLRCDCKRMKGVLATVERLVEIFVSIIEVVNTSYLGPHSIMRLQGQAVQSLLGRRLRYS